MKTYSKVSAWFLASQKISIQNLPLSLAILSTKLPSNLHVRSPPIITCECRENFHSGPAVLVGLIVKLSPWANVPWGGKRPPCRSLAGEGAAKAWYGLFVSLENQFTDHVSALSLSWQIHVCHGKFMFQADLSMKRFPYVLGVEAESGHGGWCGLEFSTYN